MNNFVLFQFSWIIVLLFFITLIFFALKIFLHFKKTYTDIAVCFVFYSFSLAFLINFC